MAVIEATLEKILEDRNDWEEVFGEASQHNCQAKADVIPPGANVDPTAPKRTDIARVIASVNGENDGEHWLGVFELKDGRFLFADGWCDYTGWDCQAGNSLELAESLDDLLLYGLNESERKRLGI